MKALLFLVLGMGLTSIGLADVTPPLVDPNMRIDEAPIASITLPDSSRYLNGTNSAIGLSVGYPGVPAPSAPRVRRVHRGQRQSGARR